MMSSFAVLTLLFIIDMTIISHYVIFSKPIDNNQLNGKLFRNIGSNNNFQLNIQNSNTDDIQRVVTPPIIVTNVNNPLLRQGILYSDPTFFPEPSRDTNSQLKLKEDTVKQFIQLNQEPVSESAPQTFGSRMVYSIRSGIEQLYNIVNPFQYMIPEATRNLKSSINTLSEMTGELIPTFMQLSREGRNLSKITMDFATTYLKLSSVVTNDLPQISTSLPNSLMQLANAVSTLRNSMKDVPLELRKSSVEMLMNLPYEVRQLRQTVGTFQALVTDTLPKTVLLAAGTAQSSIMNVTRVTVTINNLANAAKELPDNVQRLQAAISSISNTIQRLPPGVQLSEEVIRELADTMKRLPDIVKAVPGNIMSLTNVIQNLKSTIKRAPADIKGMVGLLPAIGDRDPIEAMNRIRLKEYFAGTPSEQPSVNVTLGKSLVNSYKLNTTDKTGIDNTVRNIAGSLREAIAMVQGQSGANQDVLSPVKPLVQSFQSLLDVIGKMPIADKIFPRATFEPILNLVKTLTASVNKLDN